MAVISSFYNGAVDEIAWSEGVPRIGSAEYGVVGVNDFRVTAVAGQDRTVSVAAGKAWGKGVHDAMDLAETVQLPSVSAGSRWDLIAIRRVWSTNTTTVVRVGGSGTRGIPAGRLTGYGTTDDQPIALVRVQAGSTVIQEIIDLRCWAGNGGIFAADKLSLSYLEMPGACVRVGTSDWVRTTAAGWVEVGHQQERLAPTGTTTGTNGWAIDGDILVESFGSGKKVTLALRITRTGSTYTLNAGGHQTIATVTPAAARGGSNLANYFQASVVGPGQPARTASLLYGNGDGILRIKNTDVSTVIASGASFAFDHTYYIP